MGYIEELEKQNEELRQMLAREEARSDEYKHCIDQIIEVGAVDLASDVKPHKIVSVKFCMSLNHKYETEPMIQLIRLIRDRLSI